MSVSNRKRLAPSIETFKGGVRIVGLRGHGKGNDNPSKRGEIKGWSKDSRKRMREYLLTHFPKQGHRAYGATFTVPGPSIEPDQARRLWDHFTKHFLTRNGCGAVWRLEVQQRGAAHWHCLISAPEKINGEKISRVVRKWWLDAIDNLPPWYVHPYTINGTIPQGCQRYQPPGCLNYWEVSREPATNGAAMPECMGELQAAADWLAKRKILFGHSVQLVTDSNEMKKFLFSKWPGAEKFSVDFQTDGGRGAWLRYLQDHATKAKQEQIAEGFGRHWGVVGRSCFSEDLPDGEMVFSSRESYFKFWRAYHRLTRPVMSYRKRREKVQKFSARPFSGRSLGWSSSRGIYGTSVWFSKPSTVMRLAQWAEGR